MIAGVLSPASVIFVTIGGVTASGSETGIALDILRSWRTTTVQVPLRRARNPLGWCNYHQAAEPYLARIVIPMMGKGANGRPRTKLAFCLALEAAMEQVTFAIPYAGLLSKATEAFSSDAAYSVGIARSAVAIMSARHRASLRSRLITAGKSAMDSCESSPSNVVCTQRQACGTGRCPFGDGSLRFVGADAAGGRTRRPARHLPGGTYDPAAGLPELEAAEPFGIPGRAMAAA
jgi:hypothetical protein